VGRDRGTDMAGVANLEAQDGRLNQGLILGGTGIR
jgi:hypothetical protein